MSNLAIVAIPAEDDYIHKISSEKVPHCTLLFLGDVEDKPVLRIASFLQHAVEIMELAPFGLEVDYRAILGEDEADVLHFKKEWSARRIDQFRGHLLKNNEIRDAYDSVEQFPEWLPHLTLGYPRTPAREDKRDYPGIRWVEFDRIALWHSDYEGPEFRLEYNYNYDLAEVAMSMPAERGREFLEHYGVKGMKWGKSSAASTPVSTTTVINKGLRSKTKIKGTGGKGSPAADDAIKAAVTKQKLKKSGPTALSNKELQDLSTRMNLEQQAVQAVARNSSNPARKFVAKTVAETGKQQVSRVANKEATKQVDELLRNR